MSKATTTAAAADDELSPSAFTGMSKLRAGQDSHDLSDALIDAAGSEDGEFVAGKIRKKGFVEPERRTTWYNAAFILVAELVGTGILGLPYTFATVGWIPGVALLFVFAGLAFYSGYLLWRLQISHPLGITYGDLAGEVVGPFGKNLVFVFIYTAFFGNMAILLLTCSDALAELMYDQLDICLIVYTAITAAVLMPVCQLRSLHAVSFIAAFSGGCIFVAVVIILGQTYTCHGIRGGSVNLTKPSTQLVTSTDFLTAMAAATTAIFAFGGQGLYMELMSEMRDPGEFPKALTATSVGVLTVYLLIACSCYAVYGSTITGNVLFYMPDDISKRFSTALLFLHVCVSYVMAQQVVGRAIHVRVDAFSVDKNNAREKAVWFGITSSMLLLSWLIANAVPFFSELMGLIAAISTAPLTFGFPALFFIVSQRRLQHRILWWEWVLLSALLAVAVFMLVVGVISNAKEIIEQWSSSGAPFSCRALEDSNRTTTNCSLVGDF